MSMESKERPKPLMQNLADITFTVGVFRDGWEPQAITVIVFADRESEAIDKARRIGDVLWVQRAVI